MNWTLLCCLVCQLSLYDFFFPLLLLLNILAHVVVPISLYTSFVSFLFIPNNITLQHIATAITILPLDNGFKISPT